MQYGRLLIIIFLSVVLGGVVGSHMKGETSRAPLSTASLSSRALALTAEGTTLLAVNPDSNSLTFIDTATYTVQAEIPVGLDPRTVTLTGEGRTAYVANYGAHTVSVIDIATRHKTADFSVGYRPYGVLVSPDGRFLYVTAQGADQLQILDAQSGQIIATFSLPDRPSGLALTADGHHLLITHLLSGHLTVIDVNHPYNSYLPLIASRSWLTRAARTATAVSPSSPTHQTIPLFADSNLLQAIILSPDGQTAYIPHTRSNSSNRALTFDTTVFPLVSQLDLTTMTHLSGQQFDLGTLDPPGVGLPFDAAVTPNGRELWVVNAASNDLSVIDLETRQVIAHIEVQDNPRAIILSPDGQTAYVNNTLAGTVSILDTNSYTVTHTITTTTIPLPPLLLTGKQLFNSSDDARLSKNQWIACSTCHFEGEHDGRTWFFGFAGPRNTTSLRGMIETYPLRWSGEWDESADSEFAIRRENFGGGLITGEMHCALFPPDCVDQPPNQGQNEELDALAAFIDSLAVLPSPTHAQGQPLTPQEETGRLIYETLNCDSCHPAPLYTDLQSHNVGTATADEKIGPAYDTPTLRGLVDSAPYFHDGSAPTLTAALSRPTTNNEHNITPQLSDSELRALLSYLLALPYD